MLLDQLGGGGGDAHLHKTIIRIWTDYRSMSRDGKCRAALLLEALLGATISYTSSDHSDLNPASPLPN